MHITYLIPTLDRIGGAERQVIALAAGMAQRGSKITLIALSGDGGNSFEELRARGIEFHSLEMRKGLLDPRGWLRLNRQLHAHTPDLIHAHLPHAALLARWSRLAAPVRVLIDTIHSPATGGLFRRVAYRLTSRLPNIVAAVSTSAAEPWLNTALLDRANLAIIPNGIDLDYWKPDPRFREQAQRQPEFTNKFVWLAVGRLDPVKDHATLLRAFGRLPVHAHLAIAGTGPLEPKLRRLASQLGIAGRVSFLGFQRNILCWMQQADAFVLNSRWEGLPVALIEACACELPAVITNTPGAREVLPDPPVQPVPISDSSALASAMTALMSRPAAERQKLGARARQSIIARFSLTNMLDSYEALYRDALSINPWPSRWRAPR